MCNSKLTPPTADVTEGLSPLAAICQNQPLPELACVCRGYFELLTSAIAYLHLHKQQLSASICQSKLMTKPWPVTTSEAHHG